MATIFEVTAALSGLALFCLLFLGFRSVRADLRSLERSVREGMGVLAGSVSESTATQRRELASAARALPAEPAPAPSPPPSPLARPEVRRLAQRLAEGQDAARARLKLPVLAPAPAPEVPLAGEASEDEHKTIEVPIPVGVTARPPPTDLDEEPEELTTVAAPPKASTHAAPRKPPPELLRCGYRYVGKERVQRRSDPPADVLREAPGRRDATAETDTPVEATAVGAGVRIGDDEKTPPSGTLVHVGRIRPEGDDPKRRSAGAFPLFRPGADYPAIEVPAPHRGARPSGAG